MSAILFRLQWWFPFVVLILCFCSQESQISSITFGFIAVYSSMFNKMIRMKNNVHNTKKKNWTLDEQQLLCMIIVCFQWRFFFVGLFLFSFYSTLTNFVAVVSYKLFEFIVRMVFFLHPFIVILLCQSDNFHHLLCCAPLFACFASFEPNLLTRLKKKFVFLNKHYRQNRIDSILSNRLFISNDKKRMEKIGLKRQLQLLLIHNN